MKSFLYAAMAASLLMTIGCGQKKEVAPIKAIEATMPANDLSDDELLALLEASADVLEGDETENEEDEEELQDYEEDLQDDEIKQVEEMFKNMTPDEIKKVEQEAMAELARLIAMEQEKNDELAAVGSDAFPRSFDLETMSPEEREQLVAWQEEAAAWATDQLRTAQEESAEMGLKPILFAHNSAELTDDQNEALKNNMAVICEAIKEGRDVVISGNAEEGAKDPLALSQARAETLKNVLVAAGLDANHIHSTGYGSALAHTPSVDFLVC
jgi:outer membrane protein OmpA-like peptidoglycan-associated protein